MAEYRLLWLFYTQWKVRVGKYNSEWKKIEISKEQITLEKQIEKELADLNINIEDVISANPEMTPAFVKTLQVLQLKTWVKTPLILSSLMNIEYYKKRKELAEKGGQLTGQQSEYGTKYRELGINDDKNCKEISCLNTKKVSILIMFLFLEL